MAPKSSQSEIKDDEVHITEVRSSGRTMRTKTIARRKGLRPVISQSIPSKSPSAASIPKSKESSPIKETMGTIKEDSPKDSAKVESSKSCLKASEKRKLSKSSPHNNGSKKKKVHFQESPSQSPTCSSLSKNDSKSDSTGYDLSFSFSSRFFTEENKRNWKIMSNRPLLGERQLKLDSFAGTGILEILEDRNWLLTVSNLAPFASGIVYEFYANLCPDFVDPTSSRYLKVYLRGTVFEFSPRVINEYFACSVRPLRDNELEVEANLDIVASELTGTETTWPRKSKLFATKLTTKYSVLFKIALFNWIPQIHSTSVSSPIAFFLYRLGKGVNINLGNLIFGKIVSELNAKVSKPILEYPSLIYHVLMAQVDVKEEIESLILLAKPIFLFDKLLHGRHVVDIEGEWAHESSSAQFASTFATKKGETDNSSEENAALSKLTHEVSEIKSMLATLIQDVKELSLF